MNSKQLWHTPLLALCVCVSQVSAQGRGSVPRGTIISANMTSASASVVDIASGTTLSTDATPPGPHEVAVSNDGRWAVVSWYGNAQGIGNALIVLDVTGAAQPRRIDLGTYTRPHGMKFLPGDRQLVVTSETTQRLLMVDFASGRIDTAIATGFPQSHMVVITQDGRWAFTTNIGPGTVSRIDLRAKKLDTSVTVGTRIEGIAITPDGKEVWVGGNVAKNVYVIDAATATVRDSIGGFGMPYRLSVTADGKTAVVSDPGAEKVHLVDVATRRIRATLDMSTVVEGMPRPSPQGVILSRDGQTAFITLKGAGKVAVIDIATAKVLKLLTVGGGSDGVGFSPLVRAPLPTQYTSPAGVEYKAQADTGPVARAQAALAKDPRNVDAIIALGVAQSGARQFREAIATFTRGLAIAPGNAMLYRWRGHRYLSVREFDKALADFTKGAALDSTIYGIWYHLGIVRYAREEFAMAADAFKRAMPRAPDPGELAGSTDWLWMSLMRAGRTAEAKAMLDRRPDSLPTAVAYATRLKLYRGLITPDAAFTPADTADVQVATLSYGVGNWYLVHGDTTRAKQFFERSVRSGGWPGFGFIISEIELRRLK